MRAGYGAVMGPDIGRVRTLAIMKTAKAKNIHESVSILSLNTMNFYDESNCCVDVRADIDGCWRARGEGSVDRTLSCGSDPGFSRRGFVSSDLCINMWCTPNVSARY